MNNKPGDCGLIRKMGDENKPPKIISGKCTGYVKVETGEPCRACLECASFANKAEKVA